MYEDGRLLKSEVQLADDECCIVFDLGCLLQNFNLNDVTTFEFSFGPKEFDDYKINHRYPNKCWQTISKKYGRRVSKLGYPYVMKLNEQELMFLRIKLGINNSCVTQIFSVQTCMTKDKPVCGLRLWCGLDWFNFASFGRAEDGHGDLKVRTWENRERKNKRVVVNEELIVLTPPHREDKDGNTLVYDNILEPYPVALSEFII